MDINTWKEYYNPYSVDSIKWHPDFKRHHLNDTKAKFINVWVNMLVNNFEKYVKPLYKRAKIPYNKSRKIGKDGSIHGNL